MQYQILTVTNTSKSSSSPYSHTQEHFRVFISQNTIPNWTKKHYTPILNSFKSSTTCSPERSLHSLNKSLKCAITYSALRSHCPYFLSKGHIFILQFPICHGAYQNYRNSYFFNYLRTAFMSQTTQLKNHSTNPQTYMTLTI